MFGILKAAVGLVTLPIDVVADAVKKPLHKDAPKPAAFKPKASTPQKEPA